MPSSDPDPVPRLALRAMRRGDLCRFPSPPSYGTRMIGLESRKISRFFLLRVPAAKDVGVEKRTARAEQADDRARKAAERMRVLSALFAESGVLPDKALRIESDAERARVLADGAQLSQTKKG